MRNIKMTVAYDGSRYSGFQKQDNALSVQEVLNRGLNKIFGEQVTIIAASRTDAGVHAWGQVINVHTNGRIAVDNIAIAAATVLPNDVAVLDACEVEQGFHARKQAYCKSYRYRVLQNHVCDPFRQSFVWQIRKNLDLSAMNAAADCVLGQHDFSAFCSIKSTVRSNVRTIYAASWTRQNDELLFEICGNGFLYNMVRIMVATMVDVGRGEKSTERFCQILNNCIRSQASPTAPPQGLCLMRVEYGWIEGIIK